HPVGQLLGGLLQYRLEDGQAAVSLWREVMADAPDELACFAQVFRSVFTGQSGAAISVAYFGDIQEGQEAIRRLREDVVPVRDGVRPMYYPELQEIFGRLPFGLRNYWSGRFLRELTDELIDNSVTHLASTDLPGSVLFEPLHGAASRVAPEATAFAGREARFNVTYIGVWT